MMVSIIELIAGVSIVIALGFMVIYFKDFVDRKSEDEAYQPEEEAFCDIDLEFLMQNTAKNTGKDKDIDELKRKIQGFKQRNRFYKM